MFPYFLLPITLLSPRSFEIPLISWCSSSLPRLACETLYFQDTFPSPPPNTSHHHHHTSVLPFSSLLPPHLFYGSTCRKKPSIWLPTAALFRHPPPPSIHPPTLPPHEFPPTAETCTPQTPRARDLSCTRVLLSYSVLIGDGISRFCFVELSALRRPRSGVYDARWVSRLRYGWMHIRGREVWRGLSRGNLGQQRWFWLFSGYAQFCF